MAGQAARSRPRGREPDGPDGRSAWLRLATCLALSTIGGVGMWSVVVALPAVAAEFGADRASAALPYTLCLVAFGAGGVALGQLSDRFGILLPAIVGCLVLALGYQAAALAPNLAVYAVSHLAIGFGASATFSPMLAHVSLWFVRRRGIAVAVCASGNYLAGVVWPPIVQALIAGHGWRGAHAVVGVACALLMLPLLPALRREPVFATGAAPRTEGAAAAARRSLPVGPGALQALLTLAGFACCTAMAMPQVHIVAYCGDLGYGVARGAQMLSLMLGFGIVSRVGAGFLADRIGGLATLIAGSALQAAALVLYLLFDGLGQLYVISALFGLFQGGIVPSYPIIVREFFPAREVGWRVGVCIGATTVGMAAGGWMSGWIFDRTGSYAAAFVNGLGWNLLHLAIAAFLLIGARPRRLALAT